MTAALVADYNGETNNAVDYGTIYCFKALGVSFACGVTALIMTGTLYGSAHFHWLFGFIFCAAIAALAMLVVGFLCKPHGRADGARGARIGSGGGSTGLCDLCSSRVRSALPRQ